jgi:hypothetical protein
VATTDLVQPINLSETNIYLKDILNEIIILNKNIDLIRHIAVFMLGCYIIVTIYRFLKDFFS